MTKNELNDIVRIHLNNNLNIFRENRELIELYNKYIGNIIELFDFIKTNKSDLFYAILCDILIDAGFFSADRNFSSKNDDFKEISIIRGINIINGEGICRNIACFYEDIFSFFYNYPLKMCCLYPNNDTNENVLTYGNHMINLAYHNETIYGVDLTNHCLFIPSNKETLNGLGHNIQIKFTPNGDIVFKLTTILKETDNLFKEIDETRLLLEKSSKQKYITKEEYQKLIAEANELIKNKTNLLQDFICQNSNLTHEIKKKIKILK